MVHRRQSCRIIILTVNHQELGVGWGMGIGLGLESGSGLGLGLGLELRLGLGLGLRLGLRFRVRGTHLELDPNIEQFLSSGVASMQVRALEVRFRVVKV